MLPIVEHQVGAGGGQRPRDRRPDPGPGTGHDRHAIAEVFPHALSSVEWATRWAVCHRVARCHDEARYHPRRGCDAGRLGGPWLADPQATDYDAAVEPVGSEAAARRLRQAFDLFEAGVSMMRARLRRDHPDADEAQIARLVGDWLRTRPGAEDGDGPGRLRPLGPDPG